MTTRTTLRPTSSHPSRIPTVGEITRAASQEVRYVPVSVEEYASVLAEQDVPAARTRLRIRNEGGSRWRDRVGK